MSAVIQKEALVLEKKIAIGYTIEELAASAKNLAELYDFFIDNQQRPRLNLTPDKLELISEHFTPLSVDFSAHLWQKRRAEGKKQGLVRACKPSKGVRILDVTAGWGRDAAVLASFGAKLLLLERHPVMAALLADALQRRTPDEQDALSISLLYTDAKSYLQTLLPADYPDVIYIDPMHPQRQKSALVKKEMQILHDIVGVDLDADALLALSLQRAKNRVVVKWPQRLPALRPPSMSVEGKTVRFDVYLTSNRKT